MRKCIPFFVLLSLPPALDLRLLRSQIMIVDQIKRRKRERIVIQEGERVQK